ncbi:hypothetical protein PsorP6_013762 [Peronosclerospora sorghi]|uniref:Uncharacterized protein n=1 Tax=Peronosclerospora sorghi TaxID=230839 RepID=A0ACC0VIV9_9STRA|nr:hypothetical protein PsorP6_013762 [Peronosclerospora sorghi]
MPRNKPGLGDRCPSKQSSCLGNIFFSWFTPVMRLGNERHLESHDLYQLDPYNRAANVSSKFAEAWEQQKLSTKPSLAWELATAFGEKFAVAGALKLIHDALHFLDIIAYLSDPRAPFKEGITYAAVGIIAGLVKSFAIRQYFFYCHETGLQLRSAIVTAVFEKSMVLSSSARQKRTAGKLPN